MITDALKDNIRQIKKTIKELYIFTNQLDVIKNLEANSSVSINTKEKKLLNDTILALTAQLKILNNSLPVLIEGIGFFKKLPTPESRPTEPLPQKLIQVKYTPLSGQEKISLTIDEGDRQEFIENLSKSNLSVKQLQKEFVIKSAPVDFGRANEYAKFANRFFRRYSNILISKGYFSKLNRDLRKMNSPFILGTYVSMGLMTFFLSFIFSIILVLFLLVFNVSINFPFFSLVEESLALRFIKIFWLVFAVPLSTGLAFYFYPSSEAKSIGSKINQELPFVSIHMSAISSSGVEPLNIFRIILENEEYHYTNVELRKLINLVNFHGKDLVTALKDTARLSPSPKLRELLDGFATTMTSGGSLSEFLDKHSESLLFDYRLERERYTKTSETFMDIYISVVIAAPMILLMLFVIMGSTNTLSSFLGLSTSVLGMLIVFMIAVLNIGFLLFLRIQQPAL